MCFHLLSSHYFLPASFNSHSCTKQHVVFNMAKVEMSTFMSWGTENIIGYKMAEIKNGLYVVEVWRVLCRKHEQAIKISIAKHNIN